MLIIKSFGELNPKSIENPRGDLYVRHKYGHSRSNRINCCTSGRSRAQRLDLSIEQIRSMVITGACKNPPDTDWNGRYVFGRILVLNMINQLARTNLTEAAGEGTPVKKQQKKKP
jgi:hypothetical protein